MNLGGIRTGDIVRVDKKGRIFLAEVTDKVSADGKSTKLRIEPLAKGITYFEVAATEVRAHWKKMGR